MERVSRLQMVPAQFQWEDVGSWDALQRVLPKDNRDNAIFGDVVLTQAADCLVYNQASGITVALTGVYDLLVVVTGDAVMICNKQNAQEVRTIVQALKERRPEKL
jgi:mannose-1-phosphate guanylyltransferase